MRIAINARILSTNITGIGRYIVSMLDELKNSQHDYYVYAPSEIKSSLPDEKNIHLLVSNKKNKYSGKIWEQFVLPGLLVNDKIDVFWSPTHHLPISLSKTLPTVLTVHDLVWKLAPDTMRTVNRLSEKILMKPSVMRANKIVCVSESTASDLCTAYKFTCDKQVVIYPASQLEKLESDTSLSDNIDGKYILFVGTQEPRKNLIGLLTSYKQLPAPLQNEYKLLIAGGKGWGGFDLNSTISEMGLEKNISLTGYITDAQLVGLYRNAKCLVMPSLYEGFGLPILEAMSLGVPVITSNISSMPEIAGDAALFVDPSSSTDISHAIEKLLTDSALGKELIEKGYHRSKQFSWSDAANKLLTVFDEISRS